MEIEELREFGKTLIDAAQRVQDAGGTVSLLKQEEVLDFFLLMYQNNIRVVLDKQNTHIVEK